MMIVIGLIIAALIMAMIMGLLAALAYRGLSSDAQADYDYRLSQNMSDTDYGRQAYVKAYKRVNAPRGKFYTFIMLLVNAVLTIPFLGFLNYLFETVWRFTGGNRLFEPGNITWALLVCAGLILCWGAVAYLIYRQYYNHMPGRFAEEVQRAAK